MLKHLFCLTFLFLLDTPRGFTQEVDVEIEGVFYWNPIFRYSNLNNSGTIKHSYTTRITRSYSYTGIIETVNEYKRSDINRNTRKLNIGGAYEAISASVEYSNERSTEINTFIRTRQEQTWKTQYEETKEETREYLVGPHSSLELYQLHFKAPGILYTFNTLSTVYEEPKKAKFHILVRPIRFIQDIRVEYSSNEGGRPSNRIREVFGQNDDINYKFGGKFVYLVPVYTYDIESAMTSIDVVIRGSKWPGYNDVAQGAGGDFRYIVAVRNSFERSKITEVALLRNSNSRGNLGQVSGYSGISRDINENRAKDFLHLIWKTIGV
jgi:hypothetical protein